MELIDFVENLEVVDVHPTECILYRFDANENTVEDVFKFVKLMEEKFPNNTIVCYPNNSSLEILDKKDLLRWLDDIREYIDNGNKLKKHDMKEKFPQKVLATYPLGKGYGAFYKCPSCNSSTVSNSFERFSFCGHCGASLSWAGIK